MKLDLFPLTRSYWWLVWAWVNSLDLIPVGWCEKGKAPWHPPQTSNFSGSEPKKFSLLDLQKAPMFFLPERDLNSLTRNVPFPHLLLLPENWVMDKLNHIQKKMVCWDVYSYVYLVICIIYQNGQMCLKDKIKEKQSLLLPT